MIEDPKPPRYESREGGSSSSGGGPRTRSGDPGQFWHLLITDALRQLYFITDTASGGLRFLDLTSRTGLDPPRWESAALSTVRAL